MKAVVASPPAGLTAAEVAQRIADGHVNALPERTSRSFASIVRANVFTRFNAIISALAGTILVVGHPIDALFALVMVFNVLIGIVQETRAKRTLDRLAVLVAPTISVVRDGVERDVAPASLVLDDVLRLRPGDQVPLDAVVIDGDGLEVDESSLTGEADPVAKRDGDEVRSGSAVVAGSALVRAVRVGRDAWIHQLVEQAKAFVLTRSELRMGVDRLLRVVGWMLGPLSALLLWSQLRGTADVRDGLVAAVAGVVGLVPQGLVLLVSMAMAVAIIRLARNHVLVQELHAVEGLARVDVLCVDKTGTLTTGQFVLDNVVALDDDVEALSEGLGALTHAETNPTSSTKVIAAAFEAPARWVPIAHVPFSSARKWSGTAFDGDRGTWIIGAPEVLLDASGAAPDDVVRRRVGELADDAKRVLLIARTTQRIEHPAELPGGLAVVGWVALAEQLRSDAAQILDYFAQQHVAVKIISGDSAATVSAVARRLGIEGADRSVDLRHVASGQIDDAAIDATVFGRVLPEQKRELVEALQRAGHTVAMTGDGVNDIPALKRADIGIAVDTATSATKAVAQLVLLDGRFDRLPHVVAEGRRVIANMERVSALFVTKTVYATLFAVAIGISGAAFPFLPRHMSLVSELTIGVPAFLLSFRAADEPCRPGYLRRVLRFAVPAGTVAASATLGAYWLARSPVVDASLDEARTMSTFVLVTIALWVLARLMRPVDLLDGALLAALVVAFLAIATLHPTRRFYALDWPGATGFAAAGAVTAVGIVGSELTLAARRRHARPG